MISVEVGDDSEASVHHKSESIEDVVLSWSFEDVLKADLYKNEVQSIPLEYQSLSSYLRAFALPLIEETHAELSSSFDSVSSAPAYRIMSIEAEKEEIEFGGPSGKPIFTIETETKETANDAVLHDPETGDLIAFADVIPKGAEDLNRPTMPYLIALVQRVTDKMDYFRIQILASKHILLEQGNQMLRENKTVYAIFLANLVTNIRIWTALNLKPEGRNLKIIEKVLQPSYSSRERCSQCLKNGTYSTSKCQVLSSTRAMNLNEFQQEAVEICYAMKYCHHESTTKLIWGPPGTGKTKTTCALLFVLFSQKCRTLTCAPTNIAVVEVASRLVRLVMDSFDSLSYGYGYGYGYGLGDIVLIGNEKRMKLNDESELVHVFLDHRLIVLKSCLAPRSGWIHLLDSLVCLVQDPEHQFQLYLMNDQHEETSDEWYNIEDKDGNYGGAYGAKDTGSIYEMNKRVWQEVVAKTSKLNKKQSRTGRQGFQNKNYVPKKDRKFSRSGVKLKFEEFLIKKLNSKAEAMKFCVVNLVSHLPTSILSIGVANEMTKALMLLGYLHNLLCRYVVAGGNLREVLVNRRGEQHNAYGCSELEQVRHECVQILKSLPKRFFVKADEYSMREEIVQSSCLLFCTASSSIKLHSTEVEFLVIDEAAQLKECESTIPLQIPGLRHAVLVGDEQQLPALVKSEICKEACFGRSLFQRLASQGYKKHLLSLQYRMHPAISLFPNKAFYQNRILDAPSVKSEAYEKSFLQGDMYGTYSFIDVRCGNEEVINGHKFRNMVEVAVVCEVVANLFQECARWKQKVAVGIISPYASQVDAIKENIETAYNTYAYNGSSVDVRSIDGFQGGEKDIIIISTVRSNGSGSVGFLTSSQRANVALTRARQALWIIGNGTTLRGRDSIWRQVVNDAKTRKCFYDACQDRNLAKAMAASLVDLDILDIRIYLERRLFKTGNCQAICVHDNFWKSMAKISNMGVRKKAISLLMKVSDGWHQQPQSNRHLHLTKEMQTEPLLYEIDGLVYIHATLDTAMEASEFTQVINVWDIRPLVDDNNSYNDPLLQLCLQFAALSLLEDKH